MEQKGFHVGDTKGGFRVGDTKGKRVEEIFRKEVLDDALKKTLKHSFKLSEAEATQAFNDLKIKPS